MKIALKILAFIFLLSSCESDDDLAINSNTDLVSFSIKGMDETFTISGNTVETEPIEISDDNLKNLVAIFNVAEGAKVYVGNTIQASGYSKNDFVNPITYTVHASDGSKSNFIVNINREAKFKTFRIPELNDTKFTIDESSITANVPSGTNLNDLSVDFEITSNTEIYVNNILQKPNETKLDFRNPVIYTLKTSNGQQRQFTVTITELENMLPVANAGTDQIAVVENMVSVVNVTLNGSNSNDIEGEIVAYEWKQGNIVLGNTPIITADLSFGNQVITLTVTDTSGATATDTIEIDVRLAGEYIPIDNSASYETKVLYTNLANLANGNKFAFGQEFPASFKLGGIDNDPNTSDCKDVVGDHPAVFGIDPHYLLYKGAEQRAVHIAEAKAAYNNGSIVTFDFHQKSRFDKRTYYDDISNLDDKELMSQIVNDTNGARTWFYSELDEVLDIINNELEFPIVFRLFHEMNGDWFWWGTRTANHSPQLYIDMYRIAANYIKERTDLVLFGWTPNLDIQEAYYPGDEYVDVVGVDIYDQSAATIKANLIALSNFAYSHAKVAVLSEVGYRNYVNDNPDFWTANVLKGIEDGGSEVRIAWALAWFNAPWDNVGDVDKMYIPDNNSSDIIKNDFIEFYNSPLTLFQQEIRALSMFMNNSL